jgi:hypothetical protein
MGKVALLARSTDKWGLALPGSCVSVTQASRVEKWLIDLARRVLALIFLREKDDTT